MVRTKELTRESPQVTLAIAQEEVMGMLKEQALVPAGRLIQGNKFEGISRPCGTGSLPKSEPRTDILRYFQRSLRDFNRPAT